MDLFKKLTTIFVFLGLFFLAGCSSVSYENGYQDGLNAAKNLFDSEVDFLLDEAYSEGYSDGFNRIGDSFSSAEYHAMNLSEYSAEEAMMIIDAYLNGTAFWGDEPPSEQDCIDAAITLRYFYEYYFYGEYSVYQHP